MLPAMVAIVVATLVSTALISAAIAQARLLISHLIGEDYGAVVHDRPRPSASVTPG
jgi:hypothetical protein